MIAPDKIYVQPEWITGPERNYIYDTEPTPCAEEYIRKEALLEWAKKEEDKLDSGLCSDGFRLALTMLKQKIESL